MEPISVGNYMARTKEMILPVANNRPDTDRGSVFFIGTATVIIRYAGFTILTDPNFLHHGEQVHLGYGAHAMRKTNPALELEELPPLDLIILSHMHEDHFDRVVAQRLDKTLPIVTTRHAAKALKKQGFTSTYALKTWQTITVTKGKAVLHISSMPGKHAPGPLRRLLPPVMGSMLEFQVPEGQTRMRLYITGDTLLYDRLKKIPQRYPDIDLALVHLGGTRIYGVMVTMDGKQGVETIKLIAPDMAIPIHINDYTAFKSPFDDFVKAVEAAHLEKRVKYLAPGETYTFKAPRR
jgi:L-ascorbate metabolism protein UlaG (beta-lactamase superfamily)